jgi:hypothetical protein
LKIPLIKIPYLEGIEMVGTWGIREDNVQNMKKWLSDYGLSCFSIIPDTFTCKEFGESSITYVSESIR